MSFVWSNCLINTFENNKLIIIEHQLQKKKNNNNRSMSSLNNYAIVS